MKREVDTCGFRLPSDAFDLDGELIGKAKESVEKESLLPLIKDELRCRIQTRRLSQGLGELKVDFKIKPPQPLSEDEVLKLKTRKMCNRSSAKRCREKKKQILTLQEKELHLLKEKNRILKQRIHCLETEKDYYMTNLCRHPVISKVLNDFLEGNNNDLSKSEVVYQQN